MTRGRWISRIVSMLTAVTLPAAGLPAAGIAVAGLAALSVVGLAAAPAAAAVGDAVDVLAPTLVRSNGASLSWTRYVGPSGAPFDKYEVHRSATAGFTPSVSTLLTTIRDRDTTRWQDTTAAPAKTFYYKVVANTSPSTDRSVVTPAAGTAVLTLQPDGAAGTATYMARDMTTPVGCYDWNNYGGATNLRIGKATNGVVHRPLLAFDLRDIPVGATVSAATLTLRYPATTATGSQINLHRVTRAWREGTAVYPGACNGSGANWNEGQGGVRWSAGGADIDATADASLAAKARTVVGSDSFNVLNLVREWTSAAAPNHGMVLKLANETIPTSGVYYFDYNADDHATSTERPKLTVTFTDGSVSRAPRAALVAPGAGATVRGTAVGLVAAAGDDRRVDKVDFLVDLVVAGTDTSAPYTLTWNSSAVANGTRNLTARATDDVGNVTTSPPVPIIVDNTAAPTATLTAPAAGATVFGVVTLTATATDDNAVSRVEFYADDDLVATVTTAPYQASWDTLDPLVTAFDGSHSLTAKAYDGGGQVTTSTPLAVTVANTPGTSYQASFDLNQLGPSDDPFAVPPTILDNELATPIDPYSGAPSNRTLPSEPLDSSWEYSWNPDDPVADVIQIPPPEDPKSANAFQADVTVTNNSTVTWHGNDLQLWYRWYTLDGTILFEGPGNDYFPQTVQPGQSKRIPVTVEPPAVPQGLDLTQVRLRFDIYDFASGAPNKWFAGRGNAPIDNPVLVNKDLDGALGLERFWQYDAEDVGAGMNTLTNVANGNMLLRWSPFMAPGRGLATLVDLTYNSLEDHSDSPAGNNFSLSMSGLSRLGTPIDIHPNNADIISGKSNKYVIVTDGDGTTHKFANGVTGADGVTRFTEPPGVNLYLRSIPTNPDSRRWAFTRPDKVTYFYDTDGFPTAITDRNGNTLTFTLEDTPPGEDPGGPKKRITAVIDAGGRSFTIDYWSKAEAKKAHVRGNIQTISDHSGSRLDFEYYDDGNLLRLIQRGGTTANGEFLADRSFVFTYTTSSGSGPAIPDPVARANPDPKTSNQSTRIFSVRDPRGNETLYDYYGPSEGPQLRWKLQTRTNRAASVTSFGYDITNRITTVTAPLARVTGYGYDTAGKVTSITNPLNQVTGVEWSTDFKVTKVTEPTGALSTYAYNNNGYPTSQTNQLGQTTQLTYTNSAVDSGDTGNHLSQLSTVTNPKGVATGTPGDFQWSFSYDTAGNIDRVTDPTGAVTDYDYNLAGSANPGTVAAIKDANGNPATTFPAYDPSGQPAQIRDPLGNLTQFGYDVDGLLRSIQDANHAGDSGSDQRAYRTFLDYDSFHRLGRQSAPKSTATDRGTLIWSGVELDPNDNVLRRIDPHFGLATGDDPAGAPVSTASYDVMDRPLSVSNSDASVDPAGERVTYVYDAAGRVIKTTAPKGVLSATVDDFATVSTYDVLDRLIRQTEFGTGPTDKRITHLCFDTAGDLRSVTSPRAGLDTVTCPGNGPATVAFTATYDYDAAHRLTAKRDPLGHQQSLAYDANGNTISTERAIEPGRTQRTTSSYDQRDKPVEVRQRFDAATGRDVATRIEYDPNGNQSRIISPRAFDAAGGTGTYTNYVTSFSYDAASRLVRVTLPFDSRDGAERQYQHRAHDANGNLLWNSLPVTSASAGSVADTARTVLTYFDPGWIRTSDNPTDPKVRFDYSAQAWQTSRTPESKTVPGTPDESRRMIWTFFNDGQLRSRADQGGQPSIYSHDANNNLLKAIDASGVTDPGERAVETEATYSGFDEVAKVRHRKAGATTWKFTDYTLDANGNITVRQENGEEDTAGTQTKAPRRYELTYDAADWLTQQLDLGTDSACKDDQRVINAFWDTGWEEQREVFRAGTGCVADPTTWPKKQTTNWTHFDNGKLRTLETRNNAGTITESHTIGYFDGGGVYVNGNRATDSYVLKRPSASSAVTCVSTASPCAAEYEYDARDRLLRHQQRVGKETTYLLDEPARLIGDTTIRAGNVTSQTKDGTTTTRRYTAGQLTDATTSGVTGKFWYDPLGNVDCVTLAAGTQANCSPSEGGTPANLVTDYAYDYLDRLASARQYSGGATRTDKADYTYDALDRVVREVEDHTGTTKDRTSDFTFQGLSNLVTEQKQTGGTDPKTKTFSYDSYGHRIGLTDKNNTTGVTDTYTYAHDVHGSVSQLITDAGAVKASYGYDAYGGNDAPSTDPEALTSGDTDNQTPLNPYRYTDKRLDSGLATGAGAPAGYDMGSRRYGPDTTRFLQADVFHTALGDLGLTLDPLSQNRYSLAGGNPISYIEVDGHMVIADGGGGSSGPNPSPAPTGDTPDANNIEEFDWRHLRDTFVRDIDPRNLTNLGYLSAGVAVPSETARYQAPRILERGRARAHMLWARAQTPSSYTVFRGRYNPLRVARESYYNWRGNRAMSSALKWSSRASRFAKATGVLGAGIAGIDAGITQWEEDAQRTDLNGTEKALRAGVRGAFTAGFAYGGAALGAMACAGLGPVAIACGVAGGFAGAAVGGAFGEVAAGGVEAAGNAIAKTTDWVASLELPEIDLPDIDLNPFG